MGVLAISVYQVKTFYLVDRIWKESSKEVTRAYLIGQNFDTQNFRSDNFVRQKIFNTDLNFRQFYPTIFLKIHVSSLSVNWTKQRYSGELINGFQGFLGYGDARFYKSGAYAATWVFGFSGLFLS